MVAGMTDYRMENLRVIVVDADPAKRRLEMIRSVLQMLNVSMIREASDATRLFQRLKGFAADFAIAALPPVDGALLAESVRRDPQSPKPDLPIILVSDPMLPETLVRVRDAGVSEVLIYPITAKALVSRIESVMGRPRAFVQEESFVGPDRRRRGEDGFKGPDRRKR
jgi:two-component system, chemotaxis family, chemotaxis protein CheY